MIVVQKKKNETIDKLFRKFSKIFREEEVIFDVNKKIFYKSPSELKKEKRKEKLKVKARKRSNSSRKVW